MRRAEASGGDGTSVGCAGTELPARPGVEHSLSATRRVRSIPARLGRPAAELAATLLWAVWQISGQAVRVRGRRELKARLGKARVGLGHNSAVA